MALSGSTRHQHHFEDLSPETFERLVYCLAKRSSEFDEVQWYGGPRDRGRDVIAYRHVDDRRETWYIQCKRYESISFYHLERELEKLAAHAEAEHSFAPDVIVFATACTPSPQAKDEAAALARALGLPEPYFWARMELDERLKAQPQTEEEFFRARIRARVESLHQIPEPTPTFKGREVELDELTDAIRGGGVAISGVRGMGGIGKTALALKLAERLAPDYPEAQIFVALRGASRAPLAPADVMGHVIHTFHPGAELPASESELGGLYRSILHGKKGLLLLDDAAGGDQVKALIPPGSWAVLVTSRRRFSLPGMGTLDLDVLGEEEARELLCEITPRIGDAAGEIAELCGYLPLALELAGSVVAERVDLRPGDYARRLRDARRRLDLVDAPLSLSYELLEEGLRTLWARLAVFSIPFDRGAAAAVGEMGEDEALDGLGELLRYSLIDWRETVGRYDLHDLARLFAYDKLEGGEDPRAVHRLAAEYLNGKLTGEGGTAEEALEEVDQWERAEAWERFALRASALVGSLDRMGYWEEIEERLGPALGAVGRHLDEPELEATLLSDLGIIARKRAEWDRAIELYEQSLEIKERVGDVRGIAWTWGNLGVVYWHKGEWDRAIEMHEKSLEIKERVGDVHGMAQTWTNLGLLHADKGEWDRAIEMHEKSLEIKERVGDVHGMAQTFNNLGLVYAKKGEWDRAIELYERSLEIDERVGDVHGQAVAWGNLGLVYADKGEWDRAVEMYERSLETRGWVGDVHGQAATFNNLGIVYARRGEWDRAIEMYERSLETKERVGDVHGLAVSWENLGIVYARKGEWDRAIEMHERSLETNERVGDVHGMAQTFNNLGLVYADKGEWDRAIEMYEQSLETKEQVRDVHGQGVTWGNLGILYLETDRLEEARPLLGLACLVFSRLGSPHADTAYDRLGQACGSAEAAQAYLAKLTEEM